MSFKFQCITEAIIQLEKSGGYFRICLVLVQNNETKLTEGGIGIEFA